MCGSKTLCRSDYLQGNVQLYRLLPPSQQLSQGRCVCLSRAILLLPNQGMMHCRQQVQQLQQRGRDCFCRQHKDSAITDQEQQQQGCVLQHSSCVDGRPR